MIVLLIVLAAIVYLASPRYLAIDRVSTVDILSDGRTAYVVIVTSHAEYRLRWALLRVLARMWPDQDEVSVRRMQIITTDGESADCRTAPAYLKPGWVLPDGHALYLSERGTEIDGLSVFTGKENELGLYRWESGSAVPVSPTEATLIRARSLQFTTDQCKAQGWTLINWNKAEGLAMAGGTATVQLDGREVCFRFALMPHAKPTAPPPDQTLLITIESGEKRLLSKEFAYRRTTKLRREDWEQFRASASTSRKP
ncbi:MAG TPA: hypothetical protein VG406_11835 [Isosphaeraceae bacterium]|nr:hypothetical protein [Isosphaeraceae bacterium]